MAKFSGRGAGAWCSWLALGLSCLFGARPAGAASDVRPQSIAGLRLIGEQRIPLKHPFKRTIVGGLSGLDYDPATDRWISESDDKSEFSPGRFYTLALRYDEHAFTAAELRDVTLLRQPDGSVYPDKPHALQHGGEVPDLESVRFDPRDGSVWYSSEGDRPLRMQPFIRHAAWDGHWLSTLPQPAMFQLDPDRETGPRHNLSFEGLTFAPDGNTLWMGMEAPIYQDGPIPTAHAGGFARLTHYDRSGRVLEQFVNPLDAIPGHLLARGWSDNGASELLSLDDHRFLTIERAGVQEADRTFKFYVRIYLVDTAGATDVKDVPALRPGAFQPAQKRLILNVNTLGLPKVDNLEGMSWGHRLADGHASLVLVSDDNFSKTQVTQFLAFEVIPE